MYRAYASYIAKFSELKDYASEMKRSRRLWKVPYKGED
jgi:hypothetical protein